jgi:hypothetical protein
MTPSRIVLALAAAALAAPAFAEKCHICDFSDEPIIVTPKKAVGPTPLDAPGGLAAAPARPAAVEASRRTYEPLVIHKRIDKSTPLVAPALSKNDRPTESLSLNFTKIEYKNVPAAQKGMAAPAPTRR